MESSAKLDSSGELQEAPESFRRARESSGNLQNVPERCRELWRDATRAPESIQKASEEHPESLRRALENRRNGEPGR
eukprot:2625744-Alexandrium_andersonii.AAC.1